MNSSRRVASGGGRISSPSTNQGTSQCQTVHVKEETLKTAFSSWKIDKQDSFHRKTEQNTILLAKAYFGTWRKWATALGHEAGKICRIYWADKYFFPMGTIFEIFVANRKERDRIDLVGGMEGPGSHLMNGGSEMLQSSEILNTYSQLKAITIGA